MHGIPPRLGAAIATYLYEQALTIPGVDRELHKLAVGVANDTIDFRKALNAAYDLLPPNDDVPDIEAYTDALENRLLDEIVGMRNADRVQSYNIRFRPDTNPALASRLRLDLNVAPDLTTLKHLMSGRDSTGGEIAGKLIRKNSVAFIPIVWSPAKEVSIAFALAGSDERIGILDAHRAAVEAGMQRVAEICGRIRSTHGNESSDVTWVTFDHWQSKSGDPLLHTHAILLNSAHSRTSGRVGSVDSYVLPYKSAELRQAYNRPLADGLYRLGIDAWFDENSRLTRIGNIPEALVSEFSQRNQRISALAREYANEKGKDFDSLSKPVQRKLTTAASYASRQQDQGHISSPEELRSRAQAKGWTIPELFATMPTGRYHRQHEEMDWDDDIKPNRNMPSL